MINKDVIEEVKDRLVKTYNPIAIYIFGSYAWGYPSEDSDLDLLIIKDTPEPRHKRMRELWKYLYGSMVQIDMIVYTNAEIAQEKSNKYSFIYSALN